MYGRCIKRLLDVFFAVVGLVLLSPVLLAVAVLVAARLGRPVIFRQVRPGKDGRLFRICKFRTMTDERDAEGALLPDEVRLTPFGRRLRSTSLDELPELWNILKGDMSVVGPRPLLVRDMVFFTSEQMRRQCIRPGLTGLAQVNGRNCATWEDKLEYDVEYVDAQSFIMDAKILAKTFSVVLGGEGVNAEGFATAEDLGDYLLRTGAISPQGYREGQEKALELLRAYEGSRS